MKFRTLPPLGFTLSVLLCLVSSLLAAPSASSSAPPLTGVLADVTGGNTIGAEIRETTDRSDGYFHIDTPRMIARLKELHANTYNYLIWNSPSDFDDLRLEFLPAAQKAGIKVWVYLVPPSESRVKASFPYKTDYEQWARVLAELSKQYPVLQAWEMDDFTFNLKIFTPQYVQKLQEAAHAINPNLRFFPVLELPAVTEKWVADYGPVIDGVVAPYLDLPYTNTQRTTSLDSQINSAQKLLGKDKPLYVLLYVGRDLSAALEPTPQYIHSALNICFRAMHENRLGGVVTYGTFINKQSPLTRPNRALDGLGRLSLARSYTTTHVGDWAAASQTITVDPNTPRIWFSFWHHSIWGAGDPHKLFAMEVLIDNNVVWSADPSYGACDTWYNGSSLQGTLDLTSALKGKSTATLTLRLRTVKQNKSRSIDVSFDRLHAVGFKLEDPGFETGKGWKVADSGGDLLAAIDRFDPQLHQKMFKTVSDLFASYNEK